MPETAAETDKRERLARYATITGGVYAWQADSPGKCEEAGSAVMVAPGLALTAKHVINSMGRLDPGWDPRKHETGDFERPQFDIRLYQAPRFSQPVMWYVRGSVVKSKDTDIAVLPVTPEAGMAEWAHQVALPRAFVPWRLAPPPVGARVELYGWPKPEIENDGVLHRGPVKWVEQTGIVTDVFPVMRTHGYVDFPSFRIDRPVEGAFSGGAVFYDGALVGITSVSTEIDPQAHDLIGDTYVASLWPLILRDFEYDGRTVTFGNLFEEGIIQTLDYGDFRARVARVECDRCRDDDPNHRGHAEWLRG